MQCAILQSDEISMQFRLFVHIFYRVTLQIRHFFVFFSCWWLIKTGILTKYSGENHFPYISLQNVFGSLWQVLVADTAFWIIVENCCRHGILSCHQHSELFDQFRESSWFTKLVKEFRMTESDATWAGTVGWGRPRHGSAWHGRVGQGGVRYMFS